MLFPAYRLELFMYAEHSMSEPKLFEPNQLNGVFFLCYFMVHSVVCLSHTRNTVPRIEQNAVHILFHIHKIDYHLNELF